MIWADWVAIACTIVGTVIFAAAVIYAELNWRV